MEPVSGAQKGKLYRWVGFLSVAAAVFGGIDLLFDPTLLDVVVEVILLANVGVHWKHIIGRRDRDERETS